MVLAGVVIALAVLALVTHYGAAAIDRAYPLNGERIDVAGARLRVVQLGPRDAAGPAVVLVHGASANLETLRQPLGDLIAKKHRVILVDRPGHGGSTREGTDATSPSVQARMIDEMLGKLGVERAVFILHSWSGALGAAMALDHPQRVAGLVMLAPATHPWSGGVGIFNHIATMPVVGPLLAYTLPVPLGWFMMDGGARSVFAPQLMPDGYVQATMIPLVLRPRQFLANAWDLVLLKPEVARLSPRYGEIKAPVTIFAGDTDRTVSPRIHSQAFARDVPQTKLITLPGVGHMPQNAVPERIAEEVDLMVRNAAGAAPKAAEAVAQ
jgi:pimeloyl-ACP methyl ester carboxylesterase